jgi:hypothetical protein
MEILVQSCTFMKENYKSINECLNEGHCIYRIYGDG